MKCYKYLPETWLVHWSGKGMFSDKEMIDTKPQLRRSEGVNDALGRCVGKILIPQI